jgi:hypothetical protein
MVFELLVFNLLYQVVVYYLGFKNSALTLVSSCFFDLTNMFARATMLVVCVIAV